MRMRIRNRVSNIFLANGELYDTIPFGHSTPMKVCPLCGRGSRIAGGYSNRVRATKYNPTGKRRVFLNLQWAALPTGGGIKIFTPCLQAKKHPTTSLHSRSSAAHRPSL